MENSRDHQTLPAGTWVRRQGSLMEGEVRGKVNPSRVAGRTDCVWVFWSSGRTIEISGNLEPVEE